MQKRAYFKPKMVRVKLNPEQAVLSQCSAGATTLIDMNELSGFCKSSGGGCRQQNKSGGSNSGASS